VEEEVAPVEEEAPGTDSGSRNRERQECRAPDIGIIDCLFLKLGHDYFIKTKYNCVYV